MPNWKEVGTDSLSSKRLKMDNPGFIHYLSTISLSMYGERETRPSSGKNATIKARHEKTHRSDCNNYQEISLVAHSGESTVTNGRVPPQHLP